MSCEGCRSRAVVTRGGIVRVDPIVRRPRRAAKAGTSDNRVHNRRLVTQVLYRSGPMSRSDLARTTKLTQPTVSALVAELIAEELVEEIGPRPEPRVGKPATLARINQDGATVLAVDLSHDDRFVGAVVNLRGRVLARADLPIGDARGDAAVERVDRLVAALLDRAPHRALAIAVGAPGIVDDEGTVRFGMHLGWTDVPLAGRLADRFGLPACVGNDINMLTLGALRFRELKVRDLIAISLENAIGMGVFIDGRIIQGEHFAAGEIGHITADGDGAPCRCGRRGCLEVYLRAAREALAARRLPAARRTAALVAMGRALGTVIAPITTALNISTVLLAGPHNLITGDLLAAAEETANARTMPVVNTNVTVTPIVDDPDLILLGAASRALEQELGVH